MSAREPYELIQDWCSASLAENDAARLAAAVAGDEAVQAAMLEQVHLHGLLRARVAPTRDLAPLIRTRLQRRRWRRWGLRGMIAALVLMLGGVAVLSSRAPASRPPPASWGTAVLASPSSGQVLRDGVALPTAPQRLQSGDRLLLAAGEALRCRTTSGVELQLQGPADGQLVPDGLHLARGRARLRVTTTLAEPIHMIGPRAAYRLSTGEASFQLGPTESRVQVRTGVLQVLKRSGIGRALPAGSTATIGADGLAVHDPLPPSEPLPPLICRFDFEAIDGKEIPDVSGNGHRAWVYLPRPPVAGRHGQGLWCDGDAIMQVAHHPALRGDEGTYAIWVKPHIGIPDLQGIAPKQPVEFWSKCDWPTKQGWEMLRTAEGPRDRWGLRLCRGPDDVVTLWSTLDNRRRWMHLAAAWGDGRMRLFIDGEQVAERDYQPGPVPMVERSARVGTNIRGVIDDVRLYGEPLTPTQVARLYRAAGGPVGPDEADD